MGINKDIQDELKSMGSMLVHISRDMPYSVPANYFDSFGQELMKTVIDVNEPVEQQWGTNVPYGVPQGYFESLTGKIVSAAVTGSKAEVPVGYFEALPERMLSAAKAADKPARIMPLFDRVFGQVRWAAAAVLIICAGIGGYMTFDTHPQPDAKKMLSSVSQKEIQEYLQSMERVDNTPVSTAAVLKNIPLNKDEIMHYLDETGWE